ncbi:hypothetical protein T4A_13686 [Trichinella pseudospiralis]|uniref:Uncharacterized protein n=1 Tax=Trichinella pseudospiralis TaxID=6337 RepID=A0A0V1B5D0_TRIPS|nr:hypothetical protein T4A_13686 [Trichinella pseudospiralis]
MLPHNVHAAFSQRRSFVKTKSFTISSRVARFRNQQPLSRVLSNK